MFDISPPDIGHLTQIFLHATAPAFFLGAVAAFISLMSGRLTDVTAQLRALPPIAKDQKGLADLESEIVRLGRRASLLHGGIYWGLASGICATLMIAAMFGAEFFGLHHAYGAGAMFMVATLLLGFALLRFLQDVRLAMSSAPANTHSSRGG